MRRMLLAVSVTALICLAGVYGIDAQGGRLWIEALRFNVSAQTCADNGGGTASSVTVTVLRSYVLLTQSDANGCALTLSEAAGARDGTLLTVVNTSSNSATLADSSGVQETNAGVTITLAQYDSALFIYRTDRWVEVSRSQPQVGTTNTATLTGKTYDTEGTGNVLTIPFVEWWPSAASDKDAFAYNDMGWSVQNGGATITHVGGANAYYGVLDYLDSVAGYAQRTFWLPADWTGAVDIDISWYSTATTGNVVWQIQTGCAADNEADDPAWNTAQTIVDATKGVASRRNVASLTSITMTGCSADELLHLRVLRDPAHASDTLGATAEFEGLRFKYRRAI